MNALKEFNQITVIGKRWFERTNGNTYHSVSVYVDGVEIGCVPFMYGYGDQYIQTAHELLQKAQYYPKTDNSSKDYWAFIEDQRNSINHDNGTSKFLFSVSDVGRKKDL